MKPSLFFRLALAALVLGLGGTPLVAASAPDATGKIVFADGDVTANGRVVDTGDALAGPTLLETGPASSVEIVFGGRNVFRLGEKTRAKIDFSELEKTVTLQQGLFTSVLKKLPVTKGNPAFLLRTPTINAGVRGTSFHVSVDGDRTYFCTCNGSVDLDSGTAGSQVNLTNAHHGSLVFTKTSDGTVNSVPGGLEDHNDASILNLANRITVGIDWSKPDLEHR